MSTLTDRLAYPSVHKVVLAEVTAGEWLRFWTLTTDQTYTYEATTSHRVTAVYADGTALTSRASVALTEANAGSYFWDQSAGKVHVHPSGSVSPYTQTIQARVRFDFATESRVIDGRYYDGRIVGLPTLTMRVEKMFGDPGTLGAGNITFANEDGFFDDLSDLQWDAGAVALKLGADPYGSTVECAYADYDPMGSWRVLRWEKSDSEFEIALEEPKGAWKKKIPLAFYDRATYPNMEEGCEGDPIPIAYGTIYDVRPVCVDVSALKFKVAGHAIRSFIAVRVRSTGTGDNAYVWSEISFATTDAANGEFTLSSSDWDGKADVAVDFHGKENADETLMVNAADVVEDLIVTVLGEPEATMDATALAASKAALGIGYDADGEPVTARALSIYINETEEATEVFSRINACVGSSLYCGLDGKARFVVFDPIPGDSAMKFDDSEIQSFIETTDATDVISLVRAGYQYRQEQDYAQVYTYPRTQAQYLAGASSAITRDLENLPLDGLGDAQYVAQRTARMEGERLRTFKARLCHKAWDLLLCQFVHGDYDRQGIDDVFEIIEVKRNLSDTLWVDVLLGNMHGLGDGILFATADSPAFPDSLGGGDASTWDGDWTDAQKAWARQNVGYVTDDNGFASSTDPDSYMAGIIV